VVGSFASAADGFAGHFLLRNESEFAMPLLMNFEIDLAPKFYPILSSLVASSYHIPFIYDQPALAATGATA
jgi:hypothetical protein